jgi:hypothetical protein
MVYQWNSISTITRISKQLQPQKNSFRLFQSAQTTSNSVTIEKGNENSSILINYNNFLTTGIMPNSEQKKNTISAKFDYKVTDKLTATVYSL